MSAVWFTLPLVQLRHPQGALDNEDDGGDPDVWQADTGYGFGRRASGCSH